MCLNLTSGAVLETAKEDITVYKRLKSFTKLNVDSINDGDEFTGVISCIECSGKVHKTNTNELFLCTDEELLDGRESPEKFGYLFSWFYDIYVTSIIINGEEKINSDTLIKCYKTPYRGFEIKIGQTYKSLLFKDGDDVEEGLHTHELLKDLKYFSEDIHAKCIIPKGSTYYKGTYNGFSSYASDTLKYVKIIENV